MTNKKAPRAKPHGSATAASILGQPVAKAKKNGEFKVDSEKPPGSHSVDTLHGAGAGTARARRSLAPASPRPVRHRGRRRRPGSRRRGRTRGEAQRKGIAKRHAARNYHH